jgi:hypothetical protein
LEPISLLANPQQQYSGMLEGREACLSKCRGRYTKTCGNGDTSIASHSFPRDIRLEIRLRDHVNKEKANK